MSVASSCLTDAVNASLSVERINLTLAVRVGGHLEVTVSRILIRTLDQIVSRSINNSI